jgi:hypothetical protein
VCVCVWDLSLIIANFSSAFFVGNGEKEKKEEI